MSHKKEIKEKPDNITDVDFDDTNIHSIKNIFDNLEENTDNLKEEQGSKLEKIEDEQIENKIENKQMENEDIISLLLGDILLIQASNNDILNNNIFMIDYIDKTKVKLINADNFEKTTLHINPDGIIGDGSISSIKILSSNPEKGYARQNDLLPGTWVNIYFGGDIPMIITGKITNLEDDQIEVKTTDKDTIYINFNYQGLPENIPIEGFEIRGPPAKFEETSKEIVDVDTEESKEDAENEHIDKNQEQDEYVQDIPDDLIEESPDGKLLKVPIDAIKEQVSNVFLSSNDIAFGDIIEIEEDVVVDKKESRFNIENQTNDLLEEMLSNIPNTKRTDAVLNNINKMIRRFIQLRQISSKFDENNNINGIIKISSEDRPLAEYLSTFKNKLYWILLVANNVKKIYSTNESESESEKIINDYIEINQPEDNNSMREILNSKTSEVGRNKYIHKYSSINPYMTPFITQDENTSGNIYTKSDGAIIEASVEENLNAIINNLGNLYSTVESESNITKKKFIIEKYNLGLDRLDPINLKGSKFITQRVKLTPNDKISINSILTLPEPTVRFSKINLPGTNILNRVNLNLCFLSYWKLLKQKTLTTPVVINDLESMVEYDADNFVNDIKHYMLDLRNTKRPETMTNLEIYNIFLKSIIPKTRVLFDIVKNSIKGKLSLVEVVAYLEPFMIYTMDLTYMQYTEINDFINDKIKEYNIAYKKYGDDFSQLNTTIKHIHNRNKRILNGFYIYSNPLFDILKDTKDIPIKTTLTDAYDIVGDESIYSGSEFLKKTIMEDYSNLYNSSVSYSNIKLMFPSEFNNIFESDDTLLKKQLTDAQDKDTCSVKVISKKYTDLSELESDNNIEIYYDAEYDDTNYDIINNEYKKERSVLDDDKMIEFLSEEFKNKGMQNSIAEEQAETLVTKVKKVKEGEYALLVDLLGTSYYVRNNSKWVEDDNVTDSTFNKQNVICNIDYNCLYNKDKCENIEVNKQQTIEKTMNNIIGQFDEKYVISASEMKEKIEFELTYYEEIFHKLSKLRYNHKYKYNKQKYDLSLSLDDSTINAKLLSPHQSLIDMIIGQGDFVKKQTDIIRFVKLFARVGNPELTNDNDNDYESEHWMYCKTTNIRLFPRFRYVLAEAYFSQTYDEVIDKLIKTNGKLGDDGSVWVDKYSGQTIVNIDYDISEGYTDGFINKSRDILKDDVEFKSTSKKDNKLNGESLIISNVITTLSDNMSIDIEHMRNFIIKMVTELLNDSRVIPTEHEYKKREKEIALKKDKKIPEYNLVYSKTLLFLTLSMYLISVQVSIPAIKTNKTFPGCVRSFSGYPIDGEGDTTGLKYLSCVAQKLRDKKTVPWNAIGSKIDKTMETIKYFITSYLWNNTEIQQRVQEKVDYLLTERDENIPNEHHIAKWTRFLPPLQRFHIKRLENISSGFEENLNTEIIRGDPRQENKLLVVQSKIISFSLAIQEIIQNIVEKKDALLKSSTGFYVDNACCNDKNVKTTLQYFSNEDPNIGSYNSIVRQLSSIIQDVKLLTKSPIMLSSVNTKRLFPPLSNKYSEETIYRGFINLCQFTSSSILDKQLLSICTSKPNYLSKYEDITSQIEKLKRDGREYTQEQFMKLINIVAKRNIIPLILSKEENDENMCIYSLKTILERCQDNTYQCVNKNIQNKLYKLIMDYNVELTKDTESMTDIKNYLTLANKAMKDDIVKFIQARSNTSQINIKKAKKFLDELSEWRQLGYERNKDITISNDGLNNYSNFLKNFTDMISVSFPTMINNSTEHILNVPKYWGFSEKHTDFIHKSVSSYYTPLEKFYNDSSIKFLLKTIPGRTQGLLKLSKNTPSLSDININGIHRHFVFDQSVSIMLQEYYLLSILMEYINLSDSDNMLVKSEENEYETDILNEQEKRFNTEDNEFIQGNVTTLKKSVSKLLLTYISIMIKSKKIMNVNYDDIMDNVFKYKEAEKHSFTDRLKNMNDEDRAVDTILKNLKLGPLYSIGASKGLREYDIETYERDKEVADKVEEIKNKLSKNTNNVNNIDVEDMLEDENIQTIIEREELTLHRIDEDVGNDWDDYDEGDGNY